MILKTLETMGPQHWVGIAGASSRQAGICCCQLRDAVSALAQLDQGGLHQVSVGRVR